MTFVPITGKCPVCHNDSANSAFQAGSASRDAEVAELKEAYANVTERIHMVGGYLDQIKERDKLREQMILLREVLRNCAYDEGGFCINPDAAEALAATEPKP